MRPASYREQKACANCRHAWDVGEYVPNGGMTIFATCTRVIGPAPTPPVEHVMPTGKEEAERNAFIVADQEWDEKADQSRVSLFGMCDAYEPGVFAPKARAESGEAIETAKKDEPQCS